jgi:predicted ribosomally synthesized peptide with SipW-like signal peptide
MSDNPIELSRRKILAGLGTIGAASAGVGLGTSAYFSDEETFTNNTLVAGSLDLKVDWEEHYSDWSDDESEGLENDVLMSAPGDETDVAYVGLPDPNDPLIYVAEEDLSTFMDNTAVEAYPDPDDDGVQNDFAAQPGEETEDGVGYICEDGADTPEDLDPTEGLRTANGPDTMRGAPTVDENGDPLPLISIEDVKPGDFGELTLSFHLCDNPGYVWMFADNVMASENGVTEPEMKDPDEDYPDDDTVELLDAVQTTWWYDDDGDNVLDLEEGGVEEAGVDVMLVLDKSGSIGSGTKAQNLKTGAKALVDALGPTDQVGLVTFNTSADQPADLGTSKSQVKSDIDAISNGGSTDIAAGISKAQTELANEGRTDADPVIVVLTNGEDNTGNNPVTVANSAKNAGTTIFGIAYGSGADLTTIQQIAGPANPPTITAPQYAYDGDPSEIEDIFETIGGVIGAGGETVIFRGSLRDALNKLNSDPGLPLDADPSTTEEREAFEASSTHYIGFAWYLPVDHANEIQTDSAMFDLGFYTEQARHNDGDGMSREETTTT